MAEDNNNDLLIDMGVPTTTPSIIKVIGVGGGGGNAVNHMYREGIHDVNFVVCNTDSKALADSPVPVRLQIGKEGLGAGNRPARAREAAEESVEQIHNMLNMVLNGVYHSRYGRWYGYGCCTCHCTRG